MALPVPITQAARETSHMVRTRTYRATDCDLDGVLKELRREGVTGKVIVHLAGGNPVAIEAEEKTRVSAV